MPIPLGVLAVAGAGGGGGVPAGNAYEWLETISVGTAVASVTFSNIDTNYSSTYQHLQIRYASFCSSDSLYFLKMNNDATSSLYRSHYLLGEVSTVISQTNSGNALGMSSIGFTGDASVPAAGIIDILDPFEAKYKTIKTFNTGVASIMLGSGLYESTTALNTITLDPANGNINPSSRFSLYGLRSS